MKVQVPLQADLEARPNGCSTPPETCWSDQMGQMFSSSLVPIVHLLFVRLGMRLRLQVTSIMTPSGLQLHAESIGALVNVSVGPAAEQRLA